MKTKDELETTQVNGGTENTIAEIQNGNQGMTIEDMINAKPVYSAEPMPESVQNLLKPDHSLYVGSINEPQMEVTTARLDSSNLWSISVLANGKRPYSVLTGMEQIRHTARQPKEPVAGIDAVEGYRPAWLDLEYMPRLHPFRTRIKDMKFNSSKLHQFIEPISYTKNTPMDMVPLANEAMRFSYPWCTIGFVLTGNGTDFANPTGSGSGVLVGRNLMLTASHVAPWGKGPGQWWMKFIPGFRAGHPVPEPHSSSFVEHFYGTFNDVNKAEASGQDYVICKLYKPLGDALGWMGSKSFGDEDDYYARRYISVGYPDYFGGKPAVEFDIDIDDIDSDGDGLELETTYDNSPFGDGWSGGPLWMWENEKPYVAGVLSGSEKDELDPRRWVFGGGGLMVSRIKFGLANWGL